MAGHTSICSNVQILQIPHAARYSVGVRIVRARVAPQPRLSGAMAAFARNTFTRLQTMRSQRLRNLAQRRMASGASFVEAWIFDLQRVGNLLRPCRRQSRERPLRMIIPHRPDQKLVFLAAAMATRT